MFIKSSCLSYNLSMIIAYLIVILYLLHFFNDIHKKNNIYMVLFSLLLVFITHLYEGYMCKHKLIISSTIFTSIICVIFIYSLYFKVFKKDESETEYFNNFN